MVLITPRLVRALEPDEVPPLPTLPRRFLPSPGIGGVEKGAPGNPDKGGSGSDASGMAEANGSLGLVDAPAVQNEKATTAKDVKADAKSNGGKPGSRN